MSEIIVKIQPSFGRRLFGIIILCLSALVMLNFALKGSAHSTVLKFILFGLGVMFLWQAQSSWRFANAALILKREGLFDDQDRLICSMSNIAGVDRGWFSFKPSNGFLLRLKKPVGRKWYPGLFWLIGKRMGVGGAISPVQTKEMSDKLILLIEESRHRVALL